jgi:AcrR family transcriptional regulator
MRNGKQPHTPPHGPPADSAVARQRRDEIVSAATAIIAEQGLHKLSLARIERRAGMTRGQLTYYFPAKEDILLAVFDRMLAGMIAHATAQAEQHGLPTAGPAVAWERLKVGLADLLLCPGPKPGDTLMPLVHTFLAQVQHRPDYRAKIAATNADWRGMVAADIRLNEQAGPPPTALASVVMALFQGLGSQLAVDPEAFDRAAAYDLCLRMLAPFFHQTYPAPE